MVVVASSPGSVGGGVGIALGAAQDEANKQKRLALEQERQANDTAETRMRIALQQEELKSKLGYKDAANQAADIFGNLQPSQGQGPQQGPPDPSAYGPPEASGPLPADFAPMPGGIADGTVGSAHPDRQKAEWGGLEQYHAALMSKGLRAAADMDPQDKAAMFGALREQMQLHAQQLHANQLSASIHDAVVGGALDPTDPSTGQRTPDQEVRKQGLELSDRVQKGDPTAAEAYQKLADRALEAYTAINHRVAFGASAKRQLDEKAAADPNSVSDRARMLADGVRSGMIPIEYYNAEMPAALASTKTNTVPGPEAIKAMQAQAKQAVDAANAELLRMRAKYEPAKLQAETDKLNAQAGQGGFAPPRNGDNIRLPGQGSTYNLSPAQARVRGVAEAKSVAGPAWNTMAPAEKQVAIEQATAKYLGAAPSNGVDSLMQSRALPFAQGADNTPKASESFGDAQPSKADRVKQLVKEGKSDDEIKAAIKKEFP